MAFKVEFKSSVRSDLRRHPPEEAVDILERLDAQLTEDPHRGLPLDGQFTGLFHLGVGDHRVIYAKTREGVLVLRIGHPSLSPQAERP